MVFGLTPYEALCAATCNPAEHMGIVHQKGKLLPGMDSDLVILGGNPLEDIGNIRKGQTCIPGRENLELQRIIAVCGC